jgi:NAD(P)-dependent dehydrogenase (short-subunit alcohol dehydrogenase family)
MTDGPLSGKVAIVTGAGSTIGMGRSITLALIGAGARVAMLDINEEALEASANHAREIGGDDAVLPLMADVSNPSDAEDAVRKTISELGGLHILVNNAGTNPRNIGFESGQFINFWEVEAEAFSKVVAVNFGGPFFMARAAVGHMIDQQWGRIIGVTTSLDTMIRKQMTPYGPSKAGHEALMASIAPELEGTGVTANILVPGGPVNTNLLPPDTTFDREALIQPDVMQVPVVWLASDESSEVNGLRFIAYYWDDKLPIDQRIEKASAPAGWPQLGAQTVWHR